MSMHFLLFKRTLMLPLATESRWRNSQFFLSLAKCFPGTVAYCGARSTSALTVGWCRRRSCAPAPFPGQVCGPSDIHCQLQWNTDMSTCVRFSMYSWYYSGAGKHMGSPPGTLWTCTVQWEMPWGLLGNRPFKPHGYLSPPPWEQGFKCGSHILGIYPRSLAL